MDNLHLKDSELIINSDGSIYHLCLQPGDVAETIITVGDQERVKKVARYLDKIELTKQNREFLTITGYLGKKRLTIISTGIGTDNVDIVFNELDALFNIDFITHQLKKQLTKLKFIRIGTTGTIQKEVDIDSFILSQYAIGTDGLANFYSQHQNEQELLKSFSKVFSFSGMYTTSVEEELSKLFQSFCKSGITITNPGFYAPQGRKLRLNTNVNFISADIVNFRYKNLSVTNLEMETAGIYALAKLLGHQAVSLNVVLANRNKGLFSQNPEKSMEELIQKSLDVISNDI